MKILHETQEGKNYVTSSSPSSQLVITCRCKLKSNFGPFYFFSPFFLYITQEERETAPAAASHVTVGWICLSFFSFLFFLSSSSSSCAPLHHTKVEKADPPPWKRIPLCQWKMILLNLLNKLECHRLLCTFSLDSSQLIVSLHFKLFKIALFSLLL